jgi:hypothetical protein
MSQKISYKPLGEIEDASSSSSERPYKVLYNNNMGNRTLIINLPIFDFYRMSAVANEQNINITTNEISQRPIDFNHANKLANYILKGLVQAVVDGRKKKGKKIPDVYLETQKAMGEQPYISLQPLVCNLRTCKRNGTDLRSRPIITESISGAQEVASHEVLLAQKDIFWVVDGQHRRKALELVFDFLDFTLSTHSYPAKKAVFSGSNANLSVDELQLWNDCNAIARTHCSLAVELHLGLNAIEERQLFHDLNNLGKRIEASLALEFDRGNPINTFIQDKLIGKILKWPIAKKDIVNWQEDDGSITRKDLVSINTRLILNRTNPKGATPAEVEPKIEVTLRFWKAIQQIPDIGNPGAKAKTTAAQSVVLKALAKLAYDFSFGKEKMQPQLLETLFKKIPKIDFSHNNPMWEYYKMNDKERSSVGLSGLAKYLPDDSGRGSDFNRDIGARDSAGMMRFGAKHNDIYPIIGDMIRWSLNLPSRRREKILPS